MSIYEELSRERKELQSVGLLPQWFTTSGWQLFKSKYMWADTPRDQYMSIAEAAAKHLPENMPTAKEMFFSLLWKGWLSPSTPVLSNMGNPDRGMPVSCSGMYIEDSISGFYKARLECAVLTKNGFGTSGYMGDIRPRGSHCKTGKASGVQPLIEGYVRDMRDVAQGARRGAFAAYLPMMHGDFDEVISSLFADPADKNIGWCIYDKDIEALKAGDPEVTRRYKEILHTRMTIGKGYLFFPDKANRRLPYSMKERGLEIKASNLCVAPETLILTRDGHQIISDLEGQFVDVWNGGEWSNVKITKTGENQELITVNTSSGFSLTCTPYHKFYIMEGGFRAGKIIEVRACDLQPGDKLIKLETPVIPGNEELPLAYENGFYTGDGCCVDGRHRIYLYGEKRNLRGLFRDKIQYHVQDDYDREYFYLDNLKHKYFVPDANYTVSSRIRWFSGLLDSDGCVSRNGTSSTLQVASAKEGFLEAVQLMLQTVGVQSKVVHFRDAGIYSLPKNDGTGENGEYQCKSLKRLLISGMGIVQLQELGLITHRLKLTNHIPNRDARRFVQVDSVLWEGRRDATYCFTEPKRHMGVFNGILTGQCTETMLPSNEHYTYTCVLSSMNVAKYDEWKDTNAIYWATIFLDCVAQEFIDLSEGIPELSKARNFTDKARALGLGLCGLHTYFQSKMIPFESIQARLINKEIAMKLDSESRAASRYLGVVLRDAVFATPGYRNSHRLAIAPTKSTSLIMGGISEGINPDPAMVYTQRMPAGDVERVTPVFLDFLKSKGLYKPRYIDEVNNNFGSVQNVVWLSTEEKKVFKTAFEIDQNVIVDYASARQKHVDQGQSLNLFFDGRATPEYISAVHKKALLDENILSLYYVYSRAGVSTNQDLGECEACM